MSGEIITAKLYGGRVTVDLNPRNHRYQVGGINAYPDGVTTICNATISKGEVLGDWIGRVDVDHIRQAGMPADMKTFLATCEEAETAHQRIRDSAGDSGSATHDLIEKHLKGEPYALPDDERVVAGFGAFQAWLAQTSIEVIETERLVYSEKYFYCGKTDLLGRRKARLLIGDFKTGSGVYDDQPYQLAGYAVAIEEETGDKIEDGLIIHLDKKTSQFKEYWFAIDDDMKGAWKAAVIHYKNLKRVKKALKEMKDGKRAA